VFVVDGWSSEVGLQPQQQPHTQQLYARAVLAADAALATQSFVWLRRSDHNLLQ
jgi:hypothetical protein